MKNTGESTAKRKRGASVDDRTAKKVLTATPYGRPATRSTSGGISGSDGVRPEDLQNIPDRALDVVDDDEVGEREDDGDYVMTQAQLEQALKAFNNNGPDDEDLYTAD